MSPGLEADIVIQIIAPRVCRLAAAQGLLRDMLCEFVVIDSASSAVDKAFVQSKSRVNFGAIFPWRKVCRIAETLGVSSI